jgi:hypothetical protein
VVLTNFSRNIFVYSKEKVSVLFLCLYSVALIIFPKGFGLDADGWREILSGYKIVYEHIYEPSRFPGYPVLEFFSSLLWFTKTPFAFPGIFNFVSAILSVLAIYFFASILDIYKKNDDNLIFLAVLAFGLNTLFFINSIVLMDYVWSLAFILGAIYFLLVDKGIISALFLGVATGCRLTAGIMIIPILVYFFILYKNQNVNKLIIKYLLIFSVILFSIYSPLIIQYGLNFLTFDQPDYPKFPLILGRASIRVWGIIGTLGVLAGGIIIISQFFSKRKDIKLNGRQFPFFWFISLSIIVFILLFIRLPLEAGYLLPVVPLILILFYLKLSKTIFQVICLSIILSSFLLNFDTYGFKLQGPFIINYNKRIQETAYLDRVIPTILKKEDKCVIICEAFLPKIELTLKLKKQTVSNNIKLIYTLSLDSLKRNYIEKQYDVYYLRDINEQIMQIYNYDLINFTGKEL